jgi:hypothetical protein
VKNVLTLHVVYDRNETKTAIEACISAMRHVD